MSVKLGAQQNNATETAHILSTHVCGAIFYVRWPENITNDELYQRAGLKLVIKQIHQKNKTKQSKLGFCWSQTEKTSN